MDGDHVGFRLTVQAPHRLQKSLRGDQPRRAAQEQLHHLELLVGQHDTPAGRGQLECGAVQNGVPHAQQDALLHLQVPGHGTDAGQQLRGGEGLGQVVVGPAVQPQHLVLHLALGGEQQHRHPAARRPEPTQHGQAVQLGHHDVQDGGVVVPGLQVRSAPSKTASTL